MSSWLSDDSGSLVSQSVMKCLVVTGGLMGVLYAGPCIEKNEGDTMLKSSLIISPSCVL